ncbi:MAG TPA: 4Fe-4S dicluster domain-containing protein, partial [Anaerolineae bacterium]|nr:4Fe-4S dicluster domain-containing protein [Anaerolineae bacterium]
MARYGMVMNLVTCLGCDACVAACSLENETPFWDSLYRTHVERLTQGTYPNVTEVFLPRLCQHCENPPCVEVCPTGASYIDADGGFVLVDQDQCIECGYCVAACPYDARYFYDGDNIRE